MKKLITISLVLFIAAATQAQNVQLQYDFGKDRGYLTSTVEMFKPDKWGSTFFFIDMNYDGGNGKTMSLAYWEIARAFTIAKGPFAAHIEYDGGLGQYAMGGGNYGGYSINSSYLLGLEYNVHSADFSKIAGFSVMYKYIQDNLHLAYQVTAVWDLTFCKKKINLRGFADFWRQDNTWITYGTDGDPNTSTDTKYVFLTEPQFWYNLNEHLAVGGEVEMAANFADVQGFKVCPTLGAKWQF
jgi:hypothetical protein